MKIALVECYLLASLAETVNDAEWEVSLHVAPWMYVYSALWESLVSVFVEVSIDRLFW